MTDINQIAKEIIEQVQGGASHSDIAQIIADFKKETLIKELTEYIEACKNVHSEHIEDMLLDGIHILKNGGTN